jgi:hypothetical protein
MTVASPTLSAYLAALPDGLDANPTFVQKSAVTHSLIEHWPGIRDHAADLPPPLASLLTSTPPSNVWIREVHGMSLWLLAWDVHCGGDAGRFHDFSMRVNRSLLQSPMYRMVFGVLGGRLTVRTIGVAWSSFHRGIVQHLNLDGLTATITLEFPMGLVPAALAPSYAAAYQAGLEVAGIADARVTMVDVGLSRIQYSVAWKR